MDTDEFRHAIVPDAGVFEVPAGTDALDAICAMAAAQSQHELDTLYTFWCRDADRGLGDEVALRYLSRSAKNLAPVLAVKMIATGMLSPVVLSPVIGRMWACAEFPDALIGHQMWRTLFTASGYSVDGKSEQRPREAVRLWRGAVHERLDDWSWTDDIEVARLYAQGHGGSRPPGTLWTAVVDPERMYARNVFRGESEYVVDTAGLQIEGF